MIGRAVRGAWQVMRELLGEKSFMEWEASLASSERKAAEDAARQYSGRRYGDVFCMKV